MDVWNFVYASSQLIMSMVAYCARTVWAKAVACRLRFTVILTTTGTLSFKVSFAIPLSNRLGVSITLPWEVVWAIITGIYSWINFGPTP